MLDQARKLLGYTHRVLLYPDEPGETIIKAREAMVELEGYVSGRTPYNNREIVGVMDRLHYLLEQVRFERKQRMGFKITRDFVLDSPQVEDAVTHLMSLRGRVPDEELNRVFMEALDKALEKEIRYGS